MSALDASALLAFLFRESGHEQVAAVLDACCLSTVNLSEVLARSGRDGHDPNQVLARLRTTATDIVPFTAEAAAITASLRPQTQAPGLSLGDRACLALALSRGIPAMTATQAWARSQVGVTVRLIR